MAIYESRKDGAWEVEPEPEWAVGVKYDKRPTPWCYPDSDRFAPQVKRLNLVLR
jgi:hypothetical protein